MKSLIFALLCFFSPIIFAADKVSLSFDKIELMQLCQLVFNDILKVSFLIQDDLPKQTITVRFREGTSSDVMLPFLKETLAKYGMGIVQKPGYYSVEKLTVEHPDYELVVYVPRYRVVSYLMQSLKAQGLVKSDTEAKKDIVAGGSSAGANVKETDKLVVYGNKSKIMAALAVFDVPPEQVSIRMYVYEVSHTTNNNSAFSIIGSLLKSHFSVSIGSVASSNLITLKSGDFSAVLGIFDDDHRFKVLTSPSILAESGEEVKVSVGDETPILQGVTYSQASAGVSQAPVQSVAYKQSGVILTATANVFRDNARVKLSHQISNFVATSTGVTSSPTLIKRDLSTQYTVPLGQPVILAGMRQRKGTSDNNYLPFTRYAISDSGGVVETELVIVMVVDKPKTFAVSIDDLVKDSKTLREDETEERKDD